MGRIVDCMTRRFTAHDVADYARCPRAWWYNRNEESARLDPDTLAGRLDARRIILGRAANRDPEVQMMERLLARHQRFAGGRAAHRVDAQPRGPRPSRLGCLPAAAALL